MMIVISFYYVMIVVENIISLLQMENLSTKLSSLVLCHPKTSYNMFLKLFKTYNRSLLHDISSFSPERTTAGIYFAQECTELNSSLTSTISIL
mmetsp:Transcript_19609/g.24729  ORF Transcript_19609/g.24729 Transcript_19609/m.24729 type:complete len:93 (-) Transcript_19609:750-1028(-)